MKLRELLNSNRELARRFAQLETRLDKKLTEHDEAIAAILSAIRSTDSPNLQLLASRIAPPTARIELKIGDFKPADSGQMELYLRWLDRHERQTSEEPPPGIILCAGKKRETVEYLDLDARGIHVAEYLTELPSREALEERLRRAIEAARNRLVLGSNLDTEISLQALPAKTRAERPNRK